MMCYLNQLWSDSENRVVAIKQTFMVLYEYMPSIYLYIYTCIYVKEALGIMAK